MKDPTIHIRKSTLRDIINAYGVLFSEDLVEFIMNEARPHNITTQTLVVTNAAGKRDYAKAKDEVEGENDAVSFNVALNNERKKLQHIFTPITKQDNAWNMLIKLSKIGNQMAKDFHIPKLEAYNAYVRLSIGLMRKGYALNKMAAYKDRVYELYAAELELTKDDNPEGTRLVMRVYLEEFEKFYGMPHTLLDEDRIHFLKARRIADSAQADYESFVVAQIQGLEFTGNFPEPYHLCSPQSEHRYLTRKKVAQTFVNTIGSIDTYMAD